MVYAEPWVVQEVVDEVVDFLPDDPSALRTLAEVSHTWRCSARRWLFRTITVSN